uniref:Putative E3 ubiquitin-protein ligase LIN ARM-like domain-containing protein n=1 Tax=Zea mays TaxID=4577 RepID=A0A804PTG9_MAIZE
MELVCLRRREMVELLLHGSRAESVVEAMDVLLEYLRSLLAEEQAPIAVLLMCLDALVEPNRNSTYREEAIKTIARDLHAEDWMLEHAGFVDHSRATTATSDAVVHDKEAAENDAWLRHVAAALLGSRSRIRRPFLEALSTCLGSPDADLVGACLTMAWWRTWNLKLLSGGLVADFHSIGLVHLCFDSHTPRIEGACIRGKYEGYIISLYFEWESLKPRQALQLLLPNAEHSLPT